MRNIERLSSNWRIAACLLLMAATSACNKVHVAGNVSEDGTFDPITDAVVSFTSSGGVTYSDISISSSGAYSVDIPEGTYTVQVVHSTCNAVIPVQENPFFDEFSPYTVNLYMTCP